mgnify:CR=1 FL=1
MRNLNQASRWEFDKLKDGNSYTLSRCFDVLHFAKEPEFENHVQGIYKEKYKFNLGTLKNFPIIALS